VFWTMSFVSFGGVPKPLLPTPLTQVAVVADPPLLAEAPKLDGHSKDKAGGVWPLPPGSGGSLVALTR